MKQSTFSAQVANNLLTVLQGYSKTIRLLLVMFLTLTASTAWGQTTTTYTFSSKSWAASPANWGSGKEGNQMQSGRGIQVTTGASGANATSPIPFTNVSKIVVTYSTNASAGAGTIKIEIGDNSEVSQNVTKTGGTTDRTLTYNFSPNQTGSVKVTVTCSTNSIYLKSIAITEAAATVNHTVTWNVNGEVYETTQVTEGSKPTFPATPSSCDATSNTFYGWATATWDGKIDNISEKTIYTSANNMPAVNGAVTYYAVFAEATTTGGGGGSTTYAFGWETADDENKWTISNFSNKGVYSSYKSAGSYAASTNAKETGYIQYKEKLSPTAISCKYTKATSNTNSSSQFIIQTSTNGSSWTNQAEGATMNNVTQGTFKTLSWTGSLPEDVYVRIYYTGTTAVRVLDEVSITATGGGASTAYDNYITTCADSTPDPIGYTITYNTNGGDAIAATSGTALPNPLPTPTRQHYTFVGWYTDESCTQTATAGATIDADITLYAKWTPKVYLTILHPQDGVLLDTNGTQQDSIIIEYVYGTSAVDIPVANYYQSITRDGYKFKGWYNATSGGSKWLNIAQGKNQNLWAQWLEERTVTYYSIGQVYDTQTYGNGETLTLPTTAPTACDGYTFVGWTTAEQSETTTKPTLVSNTTVVSSDMILYAVYAVNSGVTETKTDELTRSLTGVSGTTYAAWSGKTVTSLAVYAGQSAGGNEAIQLRSNNSNSGIITTTSGGKVTKVEVEWQSGTSSGRTLDVYGKNSAYSEAEDLYNTSLQGTKLGSIIYGTSTELEITGDYEYVGLRSKDGAMYLSSIFITWLSGSTTIYTTSPNCCPVNLEKPQVSYSVADGAVTLNWTMTNNAGDVADYTVACVGGETYTTTATSYTFTGLTNCTEYTFTVKANGDGTDVCSSAVTTVTATPAAGSFVVTFDYGSGEGTPTQWTSGCSNGTSTTLPTPTTLPDNHTFVGWYDGTNVYVAGDNYTPTSDITLYARYQREKSVDIVEWEPDAVTIEINTEGSAQVQIENQTTHGSSSNIADNLFFSKYYESTNNVKLLAVFNGTGSDVDLSDFRIRLSSAGKTVCSGTTTWSSTITLSGTLEQGKEYILYEDGNNDTDEEVMACVQENHADELATWNLNTSVSFSGNDAVILEQNNGSSYEIIDIIGAGTSSAANLGSTCNEGVVDAVDFMDAKGWYSAEGESIEDGSTIALSTNRCLLVRKSTVKSGAIAVAKNTTDFVTLGGEFGEWIGKQIPNGSDEGVQASCDGFDFVGTFNYGGYYQTYDSLTRVDLGGNKNADGTYTIPVPQLDTLSCTKMRIQVYNAGGDVVVSSEYKVPIMVENAGVTTTDELFSKHGVEGCRDCDVVVLKNATLQKAANGSANDMPEVRDMEVYAGGKLVIPNGTNYTMRKLVMRSKGDEVPVAEIDGTAVITDKLYHTKRIDAQKFYFFSLPYDCNVADMMYYNEETLGVRGVDYVIKYYDGEGRANGQNAGHWEDFTGATLKAGVGYILAVDASLNGDFDDNPKKEFLFPMTKTLTETSNKTVAVGTWGIGDATIGDNHKGWNLIGTPFMSHYNPISATGLKVGTYTDGEWNSEGTIFTYNESVTVPYVTMPNADGKTYTQRLASSQDLEPFKSFFIQVGKEGDVITDVAFSSAERLSKAPHRAPAVDATVWVELELKNTSGSDFTTIILDENCTADYEIGADLEKMLGYAALPQFYSLQSNARLAFNALPSEVASVAIPLGFYAPKSDTYTIALNTEKTQNLEGVYLTDNVTGTITNLLLDDYTFSSAKVLNETRFSIAVVRAVTAVDNVLAEKNFVSMINKSDLHIKNAPIGSELRVYDTLGREVISDQIDVEQKIYHLHTAGVYHVQIISKDKKSVYKVVSY